MASPSQAFVDSCYSGLSCCLQRQQQTMRQVLAAWQLQCRRMRLLQHALARLMHRSLAEAFGAWRQAALLRARRRSLLHVGSRLAVSPTVLLPDQLVLSLTQNSHTAATQ